MATELKFFLWGSTILTVRLAGIRSTWSLRKTIDQSSTLAKFARVNG